MLASPHHLLSPHLSIAQSAHGSGVLVSEPIDVGDVLVRVPASLCITASLARRTDGVRQLLEQKEAEPHVAIALWLMHAVHTTPPAHAPWLRMLPDSFDCPLSWSEADLSWLQKSPARQRADIMRQWAGEEWQRLLASPAHAPTFNTSRVRFDWALCAVWSRSFQYQCGSDQCEGGGLWRVLAPIADMFNHAGGQPSARLEVRAHEGKPELWHSDAVPAVEDEDPSRWHWRREAVAADEEINGTGEALLLLARRPLTVGEAVELDYGARSNAEMLTTHGFAILDNPYEEMALALAPTEEDELGPIKKQILHAGNISSPYALNVGALRSDSDLLVALRILVATPTELKQYATAFKGAPLSAGNELRWRRLLKARVSSMLEYAQQFTDIHHDEMLLRQADDIAIDASSAGHAELSSRQKMAVITRLSEKRLLREVLLELDQTRVDVQ